MAFEQPITDSLRTSSRPVTVLKALAHHEAGHVVADRLGNVVVTRVLISGSAGGRTDVDGLDEDDLNGLDNEALRQKVEPAVVALLAGPFAEEAYTGTYDAERAEVDLNKAAVLGLACLPDGTTWPAYDQVLTERARRIVADHWGTICQLAKELEQAGHMTAKDLDRFFASGRMT